MGTGLILILLVLGDGTEHSCHTDTPIVFSDRMQEVTIENCGGRRIQCRPQEVVFYLPDQAVIDLGFCPDIIFADSFEELQ